MMEAMNTPEGRAQLQEAMKDPQVQRQIAEAMQDPKVRQEMIDSIEDPAMRAQMEAQLEDPVERAKIAEAFKDPAVIQQMAANEFGSDIPIAQTSEITAGGSTVTIRPPAPTVQAEPTRDQFEAMKLSELQTLATGRFDAAAIAAALDSDNPKSAFVDMLSAPQAAAATEDKEAAQLSAWAS